MPNARKYKKSSTNIKKLQKSVEGIKRELKEDTGRVGLYHRVASAGVGTAPYIIPLCPSRGATADGFSQWAQVFSNDQNCLESSKVRFGKMNVDMQFTSYSEKSPITFTCFLVKLREKTAKQVITDLGDDLSGTWVDGTHYARGLSTTYAGNSNCFGFVHLNPELFKVVKKKQFTIGAYEATTSALQGTRAYSAIKGGMEGTLKNYSYQVPLGYQVVNHDGSWTALNPKSGTKILNRHYIVVFSDNEISDAGESPTVSITALTHAYS